MSELANEYENIKSNKKSKYNDIRVIVLTNRSKKNKDKLYITAERIKEECEKNKIPYYILFSEDGYISKKSSEYSTIHNKDDEEGFKISRKNTVAIIRGMVGESPSSLDLVSQLERLGLFIINNRDTIETCRDKYRTILKLASSGLPSPKTVLVQNMDTLDFAIEQLGNKFPYIVKTITGSHGVGVFFVESMASLKSILQVIWKLNEETSLIIQEYIKTTYDIRVHVLGDEVIASMKRFVIDNDFRSNYSQGGEIEKIELSDELKELSINASKSINGIWTGIDIILDKNDNPYIIEINSSPGTEGIEKAVNINIIDKVLNYISNKDNWIKVPQEIGYKEYINILGMEIKAKFDTGNGSLCVIHSDEIKVDEKKNIVSWSINDKKFNNPIDSFIDVSVGGLRDYEKKRPIILLDLEFNNTVYKNVKFTLDNRDGRVPILLNRDIMKEMNVMVNPARDFVVTTKK